MEWKNSLPIFSTATETVANLAKAALNCNAPALKNSLDDMAKAIVREEPPTLQSALEGLTREPYLRRVKKNLDIYVDVFVDDLLRIDQGPTHRRC